ATLALGTATFGRAGAGGAASPVELEQDAPLEGAHLLAQVLHLVVARELPPVALQRCLVVVRLGHGEQPYACEGFLPREKSRTPHDLHRPPRPVYESVTRGCGGHTRGVWSRQVAPGIALAGPVLERRTPMNRILRGMSIALVLGLVLAAAPAFAGEKMKPGTGTLPHRGSV